MNLNTQEKLADLNSLSLPDYDGVIIHRKINILDLNQTLESMFGYDRAELAEMSLLDLIVPEAQSIVLRNTLIKYERPYVTVGLRKDGSTFPIEIMDQALSEHGHSVRAMMIKDASGQLHSEEILAALQSTRQDLEEKLNRTTSQLRYANERLQLELDERAQMESEIRLRARQQAAVAELGQRALAGTDLSILLSDAVTLASDILQAPYAGIFKPTPNTNKFLLQAGVGWPNELIGLPSVDVTSDSLVGYAFQTNEPVVVADLRSETRFKQPVEFLQYHLVSGIDMVIQGQEQPFGVLSVYTIRQRRFTEDDLHFLHAIANILATAIQRKQSEQQLRASMQEKEVLLREIHDRVKNNLQVILSLLNLQSGYIEDGHAQNILQDIYSRVRSLALVHEKLYHSQSLAQIDFGEYLTDLVAHLFRTHRAVAREINLNLHANQVFLTMDTAVPCGLIINELVTNALTHAFPNGRGGEIRVGFTQDGEGRVKLSVADDGIGFPAGLDIRETDSLGLQIVNTLVDQLDGTIELQPHQGTRFKITFTSDQWKYPTSI